MTKTQAHAILNKCKESYVSLAETNTALERTGDLCRASSPTLRADGDEQRNNRPCEAHDQIAEVGFSYSQYLNCPTTESAT
jgi:hypothetical protein